MRNWLLTTICAIAGLVIATGSASADVLDHAKLFSEHAITEARAVIRDIQKRHNHQVTVETFAELDKDKVEAYKKVEKSNKGKHEFFGNWIRERSKKLSVDGVFILVCKSPSRLEIDVHEKTKKRDFTDSDRDDLARQMLASFNNKQFDEGLLNGLESIKTTMLSHQGLRDARPTATPTGKSVLPTGEESKGWSMGGWICTILGVGLLFWVVIALIKAFTGGNRGPNIPGGQPGYGPPGGGGGFGGGGGGGFMNMFLGGMFGSMAGNWMYNSFFGGHSHGPSMWDNPARGSDPDYGGGGGRDGFDGAGAGGDFSGGGTSDVGGGGGDWGAGDTGGSFGDDGGGGGGDWGGGGGDFGGGDFGGGGDF